MPRREKPSEVLLPEDASDLMLLTLLAGGAELGRGQNDVPGCQPLCAVSSQTAQATVSRQVGPPGSSAL